MNYFISSFAVYCGIPVSRYLGATKCFDFNRVIIIFLNILMCWRPSIATGKCLN